MNKLLKLRKDIDKCDRELVRILSLRFSLVKKIALYKKENNFKPLDSARWKKVTDKILFFSAKRELPLKLIKSIMDSIHKESLRIEKKIVSKK